MTDLPSPYAAPRAKLALPMQADDRIRWSRLFAWLIMLWFAPDLIGLLSGLSMAHWEVYGATLQDAVDHARTVRRIVILTLAYALYVVYLRGIAHRRTAQLAMLYGLVEIARTAEALLIWSKPLESAVEPAVTLAHAGVALLALATVAVGSRRRTP